MTRNLGIGVAIVVLLVAGIGLYIVGSPAEARLSRLDERRVDDLRSLSYAVDGYWREHGRLPGQLDSLPGVLAQGRAVRDPVSDSAYRYIASADSSYQLCASFARVSQPSRYGVSDADWAHPAGPFCFPLHASSRR